MDKKHIKVLLIEDNPGDVRLIREMVREAGAARFELTNLKRLDEGLKRLGEEVFGVLLVDLSLPDSQGLDTFLRAQVQAPEVPIIVLTGLIDETLGVEAVRKGAQDYLVKGQVDSNLLVRSMRYAIARKQAEENLRKAAEEWRTTFDSITDLVSIHDRDFKLVRVNKAYANTFKMKPKELIGKNCYHVVHGTKKPWPNCPHKRTLKTRKPAILEFFEPRLGIYLEESTSPIFNEKGEVIGSVHIAKDITKRKQSEEALKKSESTLAEAQRMAHIGNWELDLVSNTLTWSDEVYRMFGLEPQQFEATYEAFLDNIHPDDREMANKAYTESVRTKTPYNIAHRLLLKDGTIKYVNERCETFYDDGKPVRSIGTVQDITERKRAEAREKLLQKELNLSSRLASVGELAASIAHEINNPLTSIIGFSQLLTEKDIPEDIKQDLKIINDNAQRVVTIVRNMLSFARPKGKGKEYVDINSIVSRVLEVRSYKMKTSNIAVTPQLAPDLPRTMADDGQIQQVLINIIINAEQAMLEAHGKGQLLVTTEKVNNMIRISITDDGPGIAEEHLDKIFDPFFSTKEPGEGTGLGLSISYTIIKEHNGRLYAESQPGKGTTFVVELPIVTTDNKEAVK